MPKNLDQQAATEKRLQEKYNPEAIEYLYTIMTDDEADPELRFEAARALACDATVLKDVDDA